MKILTQENVDVGTRKTLVDVDRGQHDIQVQMDPGGTDHTPDLFNLETTDLLVTEDSVNHVKGGPVQNLKRILADFLREIPDQLIKTGTQGLPFYPDQKAQQ